MCPTKAWPTVTVALPHKLCAGGADALRDSQLHVCYTKRPTFTAGLPVELSFRRANLPNEPCSRNTTSA
jgi:hypothetical protein